MTTTPGSVAVNTTRARRVDVFLDGLVRSGQIPGWSWAMFHAGSVEYQAEGGFRDLEGGEPTRPDTVFRIYSMTKPVTALAAMLLFERGQLQLTDHLATYLPEFASVQVYVSGEGASIQTRPPRQPLTIGHVLSHTAGLTYGFHRTHPVDERYRAAGHDLEAPLTASLAESCATWATLPLMFDPGDSWNYSVGMDVLGRVIEVITGERLGAFFEREIFRPLGMSNTGFHLAERDRSRLATLYAVDRDGRLHKDCTHGLGIFDPTAGHYGGGGLVSTRDDYVRFAQLLLNRGQLPDGSYLLSPRTVDFMIRNHLPVGADIAGFGRPMSNELGFVGLGQALGGTVVLSEERTSYLTSTGEYSWAGIAGTYFWVSPTTDTGVVVMLQALPAAAVPIRGRLHQLVHQCILE